MTVFSSRNAVDAMGFAHRDCDIGWLVIGSHWPIEQRVKTDYVQLTKSGSYIPSLNIIVEDFVRTTRKNCGMDNQ